MSTSFSAELWVGVHCNKVYEALGLGIGDVLAAMRQRDVALDRVFDALKARMPDAVIGSATLKPGGHCDARLSLLFSAGDARYVPLVLGKPVIAVEGNMTQVDPAAITQAIEDLASLFERNHIAIPKEAIETFLYVEDSRDI